MKSADRGTVGLISVGTMGHPGHSEPDPIEYRMLYKRSVPDAPDVIAEHPRRHRKKGRNRRRW